MYITEFPQAIATVTANCVSAAPLKEAHQPLIVAAEVFEHIPHGLRYKVQLASDELELDAYGVPVPKDYQTIDVVVTENKASAIRQLVDAARWLKGWTIIDYWQPLDGECPF